MKETKEMTNEKPKKNILIAIVAVIVIILVIVAACMMGGGKAETVTCTMDSKQPSGNMDTTVVTKFKGGKLENMSMEIAYKLNDTYASQIDTFYDTMKKTFDSTYGKKEGITVNVEKQDKAVSVKLDMTKDGIKNAADIDNAISTAGDKAEFVSGMEKEGYKCETK